MKHAQGTLAVLLSAALWALPAAAGDEAHHWHGPPEGALKACAGLAADAACQFTFGEHSVTGTCVAPPHDASGALACRPNGPPPGHHRHGPPEEALKACTGLAADAACQITFGEHSLTGTCVAPPHDASGALACRPNGPPPGHHRHGPPEEALKACAGLAADAACAFAMGSRNLTGICVAPPHDATGPLACRPAGLPPPPEP